MGLSLTKKKRTAADAWIESLDPLNGLSIAQARSTYNAARRNGSPLLQKMYAEIEESDPVLMTCVERRQSALAGLGWRTVANASARDAVLAEEQRSALEEFANGIEDLDDAIEHLGLGFFRGYSVCQPIWDGLSVRRIELLDSWNFLKGEHGELLWNPECSMDPSRCEEITPEARAVVFRRRRAIDWPALIIYIRKFIGERDWGRFLERYGIPPVDVVMAPNTTNAQRDDYLESAEAARDGRPAAWPAGSQISRAEGSRGQDPFSTFIDHQEKLVVLMSTGGTLTSLAQADTGALAGGAQMDVWTQIVARDGVAISAALNRDLFAPFLREAFPGRTVSARLELGREDAPSAAEAAELAVKLRGAGYRVDQAQLEEAIGYKLEREETAPQQPGFGGMAFNRRQPAAAPAEPRRAKTPTKEDAQVDRLAAAFQKDMRPVGEELRKLLETPEGDLKAACNALAKRLPKMIPASPAMADALEEEMARAVAGEVTQKEALANSIANPCPKCHRNMPKDGSCSFCSRRAANHEAGKAAFSEVAKTHTDKIGAMARDSIGKIDFIWGDEREGICHIMGKHIADAEMIPGVIAYGDIYEDNVNGKYYIVKKRNLVVLRKQTTGNHYLVTGYTKNDPNAISRIRKENRLVEKGE